MQFVEVISNGPINEDLKTFIEELDCFYRDTQSGKSGSMSMRIIVDEDDLAEILENIEMKVRDEKVVVYDVRAVIPRVEEKEEEEELAVGRFFKSSKEELRELIAGPVNLSFNFLIMVIMSAIVAGIGILQQNVAIVIGAMVIAPFLGPNMLISFGISLGSVNYVYRGLKVAGVATFLAVGISVLWGLGSDQIHDVPRDYLVSLQDIALAMACGFAGALSLMSRQGIALVGVMVAAALLPPLIATGLFLGGGHYEAALNKLLLFAINIVSLILSGVIMFYASGITPIAWWEKEQARKRALYAVLILSGLLLALGLLIGLMG